LRHYEIMLLIHPDQSERARVMMDRYVGIIEGGQGQVHRNEDLGRRMLAYPIAKVQKAHYMLMNVECARDTLDELVGALHFSDAVLRHLVVRRDDAVSEQSVLARAAEKEAARENREFPYDREVAHGRRAKRDEGSEKDARAKAATDDAPASEAEPKADAAAESEPAGEAAAPPESESVDEADAAAESEATEESDAAPEASDESGDAAEEADQAEEAEAAADESEQAAEESEAAAEEATDSSADEPPDEAESQTDDEPGESDAPVDDAAAGEDDESKEEKE